MDDIGTSDPKYMEMKAFLNQKCLVYPINFMTLHNLFNLHYVFYDEKIAINYHLMDKCLPHSKEPSEMQKMCKLLQHEDWEILELSEKEFKNWTREEKIENVKGWLKEAKAKQVEKGLIKAQWEPPL